MGIFIESVEFMKRKWWFSILIPIAFCAFFAQRATDGSFRYGESKKTIITDLARGERLRFVLDTGIWSMGGMYAIPEEVFIDFRDPYGQYITRLHIAGLKDRNWGNVTIEMPKRQVKMPDISVKLPGDIPHSIKKLFGIASFDITVIGKTGQSSFGEWVERYNGKIEINVLEKSTRKLRETLFLSLGGVLLLLFAIFLFLL